MVEITNEIHVLRIQKEGMRKESLFRKQREEQLEQNLKKARFEVEKACFERDDICSNIDCKETDFVQLKEENKKYKKGIEELRLETIDNSQISERLKTQL